MATLRKNGLQSSCEPCRKTKLRCDHHFPICGRCARTNKQDRCVYLSSPSANTTPSTKKTTAYYPRRVRQPACDLAARVSNREDRPAPKRRRLLQSEYLGMTSHFALFKESTDHLGIAALHGTHGMNDETSDLNSNALPIEPSEVREGANLLRFLRDISVYQRIAEAWLRTTQESDFIGRPLVELTFQSLQGFSCALSPTCEPSTLSTRSLEIFHLFSSPIPIHSSLTFTDFMSSMSCRWEIIGLAFSFVGVGTVMPCDWDTMFQVDGKPVISRKELGILALSATETCLRFCNEARVLNDAVSWLFYQHTYLTTLIHGDRDYRSWRALGDLSTIVFTLGLNQSSDDPETPFWLSETRKRQMGAAFSMDKQLATFLGRPPRISWRFCNISLPLDLSFTETIAEPSARDAATNRLDANGWNTIESDMQAVWLRVALIMGPVREGILELSLNEQAEDLPARIEELLKRSQQVWASLPPFLHREHNTEVSSFSPNVRGGVYLQVQLEYLYNQFLLYRILSKRKNIWSPDLITISHDILSKILFLVDSRIRIMRHSAELSWVISYYGLPSAGVLTIELVRRCSCLSIDASNPSSTAATTSFSRSRVIQDLSIFASYLQTIVRPHEGNYDICQQARETILRVLDMALSPEATHSPPPVMQAIPSDPHSPNNIDVANSILDYNYYITHLDNWQFELPNCLGMY